MGFRALKRAVAKGRLKALNAGRINRNFHILRGGVPTWKRALYGKSGEAAHKAQMNLGKLIKAREESKRTLSKRKLKRVGA